MTMRPGIFWRREDLGLERVPQGYECCGYPVRLDEASPHIAEARGFWPFQWIAVNALWFRAGAREQWALLLHEAGHCRGWHHEKRWLIALFAPFAWAQAIAHRQEYEADQFAKQGGYGIDLARFIMRPHAAPVFPFIFHPPREERVRRLTC